jgi:hypothetical protein
MKRCFSVGVLVLFAIACGSSTQNERAETMDAGGVTDGGSSVAGSLGKACRLSVSPDNVDFGSTIVGADNLWELTLTNEGEQDCTFPTAPLITMGSDTGFGLVNAPRQPLAGGASTTLIRVI